MLHDPTLQTQLAESGYARLCNVLPQTDLTALRGALLDIAASSGWLAPSPGEDDDRARPGITGAGHFPPDLDTVYGEMFGLQAVHHLAHHRSLVTIMEAVCGAPMLVHPKLVIRTIFPGVPPTPPHQDHDSVLGTKDFYTVWIPLQPYSEPLGSLLFLPASRRGDPTAQQRDTQATTSQKTEQWERPAVGLGDVLIFHSLTVHKAAPNLSERLRLSIDIRYQSAAEPVHPMTLVLRRTGIQWPDVYRHWPDEKALKYYWRHLPLVFSPEEEAIRSRLERESRPAQAEILRSMLDEITSCRATQVPQ